MNMDMSRFKNVGLWVSILSLIPMILNLFGVKIVPEEYQAVVNTILTILVGLGILSNPTTETKWYLDDPSKNEEVENTDK